MKNLYKNISLNCKKLSVQSFPLNISLNMQLVVSFKGKTNLKIDNKHYTLKDNEALFILPFEKVSFTETNLAEGFIISLSIDSFKLLLDFLNYKRPINRTIKLEKEVINWIRYKLDIEKELSNLDALSVLTPIFIEIKKKIEFSKENIIYNEHFFNALNYINKNLHKEINLTEVANAIGIHHVTLSKAFKKYGGISFVEYVNYKRIILSGNELNKNKKIVDIALVLGFGSVRNFNREFKKYFGLTPSQYKKQKKNDM